MDIAKKLNEDIKRGFIKTIQFTHENMDITDINAESIYFHEFELAYPDSEDSSTHKITNRVKYTFDHNKVNYDVCGYSYMHDESSAVCGSITQIRFEYSKNQSECYFVPWGVYDDFYNEYHRTASGENGVIVVDITRDNKLNPQVDITVKELEYELEIMYDILMETKSQVKKLKQEAPIDVLTEMIALIEENIDKTDAQIDRLVNKNRTAVCKEIRKNWKVS